MHATACTSRTLFHLLWHPCTVFLNSERTLFARKQTPCNLVDACFAADGREHMQRQDENALQRSLHARLFALGVRLCAINVGFVRQAGKRDLFVCNVVGVCRTGIALVLRRESAKGMRVFRRYLHALQELLEPLLMAKTRLVFFVFSLRIRRKQHVLLLRRVSACAS